MFDPNANLPRFNRGMVYLGACLIAGIRLAREKQVNVRVIPTSHVIDESVELAYEIFNRVFRIVPERSGSETGDKTLRGAIQFNRRQQTTPVTYFTVRTLPKPRRKSTMDSMIWWSVLQPSFTPAFR